MVTRSYNIELLMSEECSEYWMCQLRAERDAYNRCARIVEENAVPLNLKDMHAACYETLRAEFPQLAAQACVKTYKDALGALRSIRRNKHKNAETPQKKTLSMKLDKRLYGRLSKDGITLKCGSEHARRLVPFVMYDKAREMFDNFVAHDPLIFERCGRFFLSVPFEANERPCKDDIAVGVDLGMKRLFVTSEGNMFSDKEYLKRRRKARYLKRCLNKRGTKSARRHLKRLKRRESNLSKDMCYKATRALISSTEASVIVMEDLTKIKKTTARTSEGHLRKRHNSALSQVPFFKLKEILTYKALLARKRVETVSPAYTSQTDSRTNKRDGERRGCRYVCSDGVVLDADFNAAVNICQRTKHPTSTLVPIDGTLRALVGTAPSVAESSGSQHSADKPTRFSRG